MPLYPPVLGSYRDDTMAPGQFEQNVTPGGFEMPRPRWYDALLPPVGALRQIRGLPRGGAEVLDTINPALPVLRYAGSPQGQEVIGRELNSILFPNEPTAIASDTPPPANLPPAPSVNGGSPIRQGPSLPPAPERAPLRYNTGGGWQDYGGSGSAVPLPPGSAYDPIDRRAEPVVPASGGGTFSMMTAPENVEAVTAASRLEDARYRGAIKQAEDPAFAQKDILRTHTDEQIRLEGERMKRAEQNRQAQQKEWGELEAMTNAEEAKINAAFPNKQDPAYLQAMEALRQKATSAQMNFYLRWGIRLPSGSGYADSIAG